MDEPLRVALQDAHDVWWWISVLAPAVLSSIVTVAAVLLAHKLGRRQATAEAEKRAIEGALARTEEREHQARLAREADRRRWLLERVAYEMQFVASLSELIGSCSKFPSNTDEFKKIRTHTIAFALSLKYKSALLFPDESAIVAQSCETISKDVPVDEIIRAARNMIPVLERISVSIEQHIHELGRAQPEEMPLVPP